MSLEKLVQLGWYKAEPSSPREIADLFSIVYRSQADMKVEGISDDLRFQAATRCAVKSPQYQPKGCGLEFTVTPLYPAKR
jgi:hypothetical protein